MNPSRIYATCVCECNAVGAHTISISLCVCVCARSADHRRTIASSLIRGHWPQLVLRHYSLRDSLTSPRVIASFRTGMFAKTRVHLVLVLLAVASLSLASKHNKDKYDKPAAQPAATAEAIAELLASADNQSATSASVYYDQRQTGKYNINVNIKDVAIISIDPESLAGNVGVSCVWLFNCLEDYEYYLKTLCYYPILSSG